MAGQWLIIGWSMAGQQPPAVVSISLLPRPDCPPVRSSFRLASHDAAGGSGQVATNASPQCAAMQAPCGPSRTCTTRPASAPPPLMWVGCSRPALIRASGEGRTTRVDRPVLRLLCCAVPSHARGVRGAERALSPRHAHSGSPPPTSALLAPPGSGRVVWRRVPRARSDGRPSVSTPLWRGEARAICMHCCWVVWPRRPRGARRAAPPTNLTNPTMFCRRLRLATRARWAPMRGSRAAAS